MVRNIIDLRSFRGPLPVPVRAFWRAIRARFDEQELLNWLITNRRQNWVACLSHRALRKSVKISSWFFMHLRGLTLLTVLGYVLCLSFGSGFDPHSLPPIFTIINIDELPLLS